MTADTITRKDMLSEVSREIYLRRKVYPRWIAEGRLTQAKGERQIAVMEAVAELIENMPKEPA